MTLPLVSIVTPVYNGEAYLSECIESVLVQSYANWDYTIINNCSTDRTLEISETYARKDGRIRVHNNEKFLGIIDNHNKAFQLISEGSRYCKVVSADDWLFPECLKLMVELAEANPSVGIVGSYQLSGGGSDWRSWRIRWAEVPYPSTVIPGREICRQQLLGGPYVFGTPTSTLYRSDLVRGQASFYPNSSPEADTSACYKSLRNADFGFVHQVLSYERIHQATVSTVSRSLHAYLPAHLMDIIEYGPSFLENNELEKRIEEVLDEYYRCLATEFFNLRDNKFWEYHRKRLGDSGIGFSYARLLKSMAVKFFDLMLNPKQTAEKILRRHPRNHNA